MRETHGEVAEWGLAEMLQAKQLHLLAAVVWQNGGGKGRKPTPIKIPGLADPNSKTVGGERGYSIADYEAIVARNAERNEVTDGS